MAKEHRDPRAPIVTELATYTRYECPLCGYDSVDEARVVEHLDPVFGKHPVPVPTPSAAAAMAAEQTEIDALRAEVEALRAQLAATDAPPKGGKVSKE